MRRRPIRVPKRYTFFLGGRDLEMAEIGRLLRRYAPGQMLDKRLSWGAALSDYAFEIEAAIASGLRPVAVELTDDMPRRWRARRSLVSVDHHGERAGADQPGSLAQIIGLLDLPDRVWTRRRRLIAANDIGHVEALLAAGATRQEVIRIRAADRRAQGRTRADEREAVRAIGERTRSGALTIVETQRPTSSAIADRMHAALGGPGFGNLLVVMPSELAFYGDGHVVRRLADAIPQSWWGGALPARGFWGVTTPQDDRQRAVIIERAKALAR